MRTKTVETQKELLAKSLAIRFAKADVSATDSNYHFLVDWYYAAILEAILEASSVPDGSTTS